MIVKEKLWSCEIDDRILRKGCGGERPLGAWQGDEIFRAASRKAFSLNGHIFVESTDLRIVAYLPLSHVTFTKRLQRQSLGRCFSGEREREESECWAYLEQMFGICVATADALEFKFLAILIHKKLHLHLQPSSMCFQISAPFGWHETLRHPLCRRGARVLPSAILQHHFARHLQFGRFHEAS